MNTPKITSLEKALLSIWFVLNLVIGALSVPAYGVSIDEPNNQRYARDTLNAYPSLFGSLYKPNYDSSYDGHGPAFVTIAAIPIGVVQNIFPNVPATDLWHFSYFITFELTGLCLYWLIRRWFRAWTAWGILLLFGTQPVLLGHAFINPKDIPFMFLLTASIVLGFRVVDRVEQEEHFVSLQRPVATLSAKFQEADPRRKRRFLISLILASTIALTLIVFANQINSLLAQAVTFFYTASPDSWAGQLFGSVASRAADVSAEDYALKALRLFRRLEYVLLLLGVLFLLVYFGLLINNTTLAAFLRRTWRQRKRVGQSLATATASLRASSQPGSLKTWIAETFRALHRPDVILAGVVLGLATAVRAIGPWAGVIVLLYLFAKVRSRAWTIAIAYFLIAGIVTYLAWPHLWGAPVQRYLEGLGIISNFRYSGRVLFNGHFYGSAALPRSYLPVLLSIQLTEPYVLAAYIGLGMLVWQLVRSRLRTDLVLYIGLGFAAPLFGLILLRSSLYHNFRQVLFLIPAMFVPAAFALDLVFSKVTQRWARVLLIGAIALPGVYASAKLYPYEYVYYNSLVGGVAGVRDRYELDYWRISLREAALEMNELAPTGSKILVTRSAGLFARYARPDLVIDKVINSTLTSEDFDYVVQVARWEAWDLYPEAKNVLVIERDGAVLATVKDLKNAELKQE